MPAGPSTRKILCQIIRKVTPKVKFSIVARASKAWIPELIAAAVGHRALCWPTYPNASGPYNLPSVLTLLSVPAFLDLRDLKMYDR